MGDHEADGRAGLTAVAGAPEPDDDAAVEAARRLFAQPCRFVAGAARFDQLPPAALPEAAFAGRSNVGKSSLVNALVGRRALARISATPGRTRQINLFDLGGRLMLADLPGYGFARASKRDIAAWAGLVDGYLRRRESLRRVCLLVDARHGLKDADRPVTAMLDALGVAYQVVLTKADRLSAAALAERVAATAAAAGRHAAAHPEVIATSARDGDGIERLRLALAGLAVPSPVG